MPAWAVSTDDPQLTPGAALRRLLGGKGAGLAEMQALGIPVPPAFVITTDAYRQWRESGSLAFLQEDVFAHVARLETRLGRTFGGADRPLVVSVRSGAAVSMPGMMDTILNLGLNSVTVAGLAREMTPATAQNALARLRDSYEALVGSSLPDDPQQQLMGAIAAVFASWDSARAKTYRRRGGIAEEMGTAATVQAMVFGTSPGFSGTGVLFSRHPATGNPELMGDWLRNAQGEDVVAGTHQTEPIGALEAAAPRLYEQLAAVAQQLEQYQQDMCDIEFTIESDNLWILQFRRGKRSPQAAVRIAVDLAEDARFAVSRRDAVSRVEPAVLEALLAEQSAVSGVKPIATGLGASPGLASGLACFSVDAALDRVEAGEAVILVRPETSPDDIPGMDVAAGILTSTGGMVSHAAIVAREWRKPAVVGAAALIFSADAAERVMIGDVILREGDQITIDGATGHVYLGAIGSERGALDASVARLVDWARKLACDPDLAPVPAITAAHAKLAGEAT